MICFYNLIISILFNFSEQWILNYLFCFFGWISRRIWDPPFTLTSWLIKLFLSSGNTKLSENSYFIKYYNIFIYICVVSFIFSLMHLLNVFVFIFFQDFRDLYFHLVSWCLRRGWIRICFILFWTSGEKTCSLFNRTNVDTNNFSSHTTFLYQTHTCLFKLRPVKEIG